VSDPANGRARGTSGPRTLLSLQGEGTIRQDIELQSIVQFVSLIANGLALGRSLGFELDVDELLRLVHTGIDPQ
jgi:hypothetical protein